MTRQHVVVVGAGLAGLSSAIGAVDRGMQVTLLEGRPRLGGATWSFERKGLKFDNGQHVYLACCTSYRRYLARIGSAAKAPLHRLAIPVLRPKSNGSGSEVAWIRRSGLPAPFHLAASLGRYRYLSVRERANIGRAALSLRRLDLEDPSLDQETFAHFLARHGQSARAIEVLWDLIALPTINVHAHEASLLLAAKVFQTGLLSTNGAADIGWSQIPLTELHVDPALAVLSAHGATVRSKAKVSALVLNDDATSVTGVVVDGETIDCDAVILAVNASEVMNLLPHPLRADFARVTELGSSPIVDVHIVYDRTVTNYKIAAGVDTPVQFLFDRSGAAGLAKGEGQCLAISISGADGEQGERPEVLIDRYQRAVADLFPLAREAKVVDAVVSRELHATFRGGIGTQRLRPGVETKIDNLVLAVAYTDTGWPATMEGAVRSGERAIGHLAQVLSVASRSRGDTIMKEAI